MLDFLTANISPDVLRDHNAEKSHVLKPYGIVAQFRIISSAHALTRKGTKKAIILTCCQ